MDQGRTSSPHIGIVKIAERRSRMIMAWIYDKMVLHLLLAIYQKRRIRGPGEASRMVLKINGASLSIKNLEMDT